VISFKKIDILFFVYIILTTIILVLDSGSSIFPQNIVLIRLFIILVILAIIYFDSKKFHPVLHLIRKAYPLILSGYFYSETVFFNKVLFNNIDPLLIDIEYYIFNSQPSIEFSLLFSNKIFSDLMYFGYFSFYILIISFTLYIYYKKKAFFNEVVFLLSASLYIYYFIFSLIPSAGPQFFFSYPDKTAPNGYFFKYVMDFIQKTAEQPTGAFPSSHVGISLIILILSKKIAPLFFRITWSVVIVLIVSTVYIKAHYVIDVIGGVISAPIVLYLSDFLFKHSFWKKLKSINKAC